MNASTISKGVIKAAGKNFHGVVQGGKHHFSHDTKTDNSSLMLCIQVFALPGGLSVDERVQAILHQLLQP